MSALSNLHYYIHDNIWNWELNLKKYYVATNNTNRKKIYMQIISVKSISHRNKNGTVSVCELHYLGDNYYLVLDIFIYFIMFIYLLQWLLCSLIKIL